MTTLAVALKDEIRRLARKEIRAQTSQTVKAVAKYRREIAALKRQLRAQEKTIALLATQTRTTHQHNGAAESLNGSARFSARSVKAQRRKTALSAADYAKLVGVSGLTVYNWEQGKSRPRKEQLASLVALRGLGRRGALAKLEALNAGQKKATAHGRARRRKV
jgi:DNA-binding transcriptional regulator YiaG